MSHTDELARLAELHRNGDLTGEEFVAAKKKIIETSDGASETAFFSGEIPAPSPAAAELPSKKWGMAEGCGFGCLGLLIVFGIGLFISSHDNKSGDNGSMSSTSTAKPPAPPEPNTDPNDEERADAYSATCHIVRNYLKAPISATFPDYFASGNGIVETKNSDGSYTIFSPFESRNSFGAMVPSNFSVTVRKKGTYWVADRDPDIGQVQ